MRPAVDSRQLCNARPLHGGEEHRIVRPSIGCRDRTVPLSGCMREFLQRGILALSTRCNCDRMILIRCSRTCLLPARILLAWCPLIPRESRHGGSEASIVENAEVKVPFHVHADLQATTRPELGCLNSSSLHFLRVFDKLVDMMVTREGDILFCAVTNSPSLELLSDELVAPTMSPISKPRPPYHRFVSCQHLNSSLLHGSNRILSPPP